MTRPHIHLICNAHLDPVWQWRWEEGCAETISTFRNSVKLLRENEDLIFNHNESILYRWILEYDPDLFREIQSLVQKNRWFISGGWYLQPDVNLPATEAIYRQIMEGRYFFKKHFNVQPKVAYNFDSFGHSAGLPQILLQCGHEMYIHMRPQKQDIELPSDLYRWRGVDGSEIAAYRISVGLYHTEFENIEQRLREGVELALHSEHDIPIFWGIGDHGGGATRENLQKIRYFFKKENRVTYQHSTPDQFYDAIKGAAENAPVFKGGLQRVFTGCYTSLSRLKRGAMKSFHDLWQSEILSTHNWWQNGHPYPGKELNNAWRNHLFNDFHDILPGSCSEPAERDALDLYGQISNNLRKIKLKTAVSTNNGSENSVYLPITIQNTNPLYTRLPVEVECMISHRPKWEGKWHLKLFKSDGSPVPCQEEQPEALLPFNDWRRKLSFIADLPQIGSANYYAEAHPGSYKSQPGIAKKTFKIDDKIGLISRLSDKKLKNYLCGYLMRPLVVEDTADSWGTDQWNYRKIVGEFTVDPRSICIRESGPIRTIHESVHLYQQSKIIMKVISYPEFPYLEYRLRIHWNEQLKRLKLSIPTIFNQDTPICEIPGGITKCPNDGDEHVHGRWIILKGKSKQSLVGLAVIHNGLHGFDCLEGEIRLSVLRSAAYCHEKGMKLEKYPARKYMDQGIHEIRLLIITGEYQNLLQHISTMADLLNAPPVAYAHLPYGVSNNTGKNLFYWDRPNIRLLACKKSEQGDALILRVQEVSAKKTNTTLFFIVPDIKIQLNFQPLQIKTIRIEKSGIWKEVDPIFEN
ncbi:MAG: hypothetical protein GQ561_01570 [Calditrichae bacterium]|nr:hypothetical protein [Calditrichia bacterium]